MERDSENLIFFADTWWFAMTKRLSDRQFIKLVKLRQQQGFTAAQIVVGIPPEVGIYNENASSIKGYPLTLDGKINYEYLGFVKSRIKIMNEHNLTAIVYGAWGYQIDWIGTNSMKKWWNAIISTLDTLNVVYCLTGEIDLFTEPLMSKCLLKSKSTNDVFGADNTSIFSIAKNIYRKVCSIYKNGYKKRIEKWEVVLKDIRTKTNKNIIIHCLPDKSSFDIVSNIQLLDACTIQTGHNNESKDKIWQDIYNLGNRYTCKNIINLEPWYEGIKDDFYTTKQVKAFLLSAISGASAICYGAHGIWNVGDSNFLNRWGNATFDEALKLNTPYILGKLYRILAKEGLFDHGKIIVRKDKNDDLISITKELQNSKKIIYVVNLTEYHILENEKYIDPMTATFISKDMLKSKLGNMNQVLIIC